MGQVIRIVAGFLGTAFIYVFGGLDIALQSLLIIMVIDYITGVLKAGKKKSLSSKIGLKGIKKKIGILCLVAVSVIADRLAGDSGLIRSMVIYYLVANEGLSILENLGEMNIIVPEFLKDKLEQLKGGNDNE